MIKPNTTVSCDSLRDSDLMRAFVRLLKSENSNLDIARDTEDFLDNIGDFGFIGNLDDELNGVDLMLSLFGAMDDVCPEGCVFSASEDDASCFGFWDVTKGDENGF